jgi:hypothetical protein
MVDRSMSTRTTVTRQWTQPILSGVASRKTLQRIGMSDAQIACQWLNATQGTRHTRIQSLHEQLGEVRTALTGLQRQHEELRRKVAARERAGVPELGAQYKQAFRRTDKLQQRVNEALARYVFRPKIGYTTITETRSGGLSPDTNKHWYQLQFGEWALSEADVAIALVRLHLTGEWQRLRLCERCKRHWLVATKSHYRFCGDECRESYYAESEGFGEHRAEIQKRYRQRLKKRQQARAKRGVHYD